MLCPTSTDVLRGKGTELIYFGDFERQPWRLESLCFDTDLDFYADEEALDPRVFEMCNACPVQKHCRQYAIDNMEYGVWGGWTDSKRSAYFFEIREYLRLLKEAEEVPEELKEAAASVRSLKPIAHGTPRGYVLEKKRGLKPCDECLKANAEASRERQRKNRVRTRQKAAEKKATAA